MRPIFSLVFCCVLGVLTFSSCSNSSFSPELLEVESYIQDRPDSALSVLEAMNPQEYKSQKNRSLHALLHAMALDKNFVDVSDDSLANVALEYFEHRGPKKYKARSLYYRGLSHYYSQENDVAILDFTKAEQVCLECDDSLYLAMTYVAIADIYNRLCNDKQEAHYLGKALKLFNDNNKLTYSYGVQRRLAQAYMGGGEYEKADSLLLCLMKCDTTNVRLQALTLNTYAYLQMIKPIANPSLANEYFSASYDLYNGLYMGLQEYWAWSASLAMLGDKFSSRQLISQIEPLDTCFISDYWKYLIARSEGDYKAALDYYERCSINGDKKVEALLRQQVASYQRDYYQSLFKVESKTVENRNLWLVTIVLSSIFILFVMGMLTKSRIDKIRKNHENIVNFVDSLMDQLSAEKDEVSELKKKYIELHKGKYEVLSNLCDQYYQSLNRVDVEKIMYKKVTAIIDSIRYDKEKHTEFEKIVNRERDDIMANLRKEMPKLKEVDYAIFAYYVVGFDAVTISRFLELSEQNVYAHKRRLRIKIQNAHPEHECQFLEVF